MKNNNLKIKAHLLIYKDFTHYAQVLQGNFEDRTIIYYKHKLENSLDTLYKVGLFTVDERRELKHTVNKMTREYLESRNRA